MCRQFLFYDPSEKNLLFNIGLVYDLGIRLGYTTWVYDLGIRLGYTKVPHSKYSNVIQTVEV